MRINSIKFGKFLDGFGTQEAPRCIGMNATLTTLYLIRKIKNKVFSYTIFHVKKINVGKNFKIMRKLLF
jgi:hypothetical protein